MPRQTNPRDLSCFAATAPGLESVCAAELRALGLRGKIEEGGVSWTGPMASVARANLWLRTASRVLVRVARFRATAFFEVELHAKKIAWDEYVTPGSGVDFRVTCRKSKLYHSDAVAQRFMGAVERGVPGASVAKASESSDDASNDDATENAGEDGVVASRQLFVVRMVHDVCTVSVDTSGALLHRRGYRQALGKAPLRETLAAAVLLGAGWKGNTPLTDPMCGAGTIAIEAAMLARRMAPGRKRSFAFLNWPADRHATALLWSSALDDARRGEFAASPVRITGSDRDAGGIAAAQANAERADVAADIELAVLPISALTAEPGPPGLIAVNPPYGVRVGATSALRNLYARFGDVLRVRRGGWTLALLSAERPLERQLRLPLEERLRTTNGGIDVRLVVATVPEAGVLP